MKSYLIISIFSILVTIDLFSQGFYSTQSSGRPLPVDTTAEAFSVFNPWYGASGGYLFGGEGEVNDNFYGTAKIQYPLFPKNKTNFVFPLVANIADLNSKISFEEIPSIVSSLTDLLGDERGVSLSMEPAFILNSANTNKDKSLFVLHLIAGGKWNKFQSEEDSSSFKGIVQFRIGGGLEYGFGKVDGNPNFKKFIINVTPVLSIFSEADINELFLAEKSSYFAVEVSGVLVIQDGIGLLLESQFGNDIESNFKIGILTALEGKRIQLK